MVSERSQRDGGRQHDRLDLFERLKGATNALGGRRRDAAAKNGERIAESHAERLQTERFERRSKHFGGCEGLHSSKLGASEETEDNAAANTTGSSFSLLGGGLRDPDLLHFGDIAEWIENDALFSP